jgi:hypothetical protein
LQNTVSYELQLPLSKSGEFFSVMRQDLERYFDLTGKRDTLQQPYYILSFDSKLYNERSGNLTAINTSTAATRTISFHEFISTLTELENAIVIADSTSHFPENIEVPALASKDEAFAFLQKAGFQLTKQYRKISVLRLTERL